MIGSFLHPDLAERFMLSGLLALLIAVLLVVTQLRRRVAARRQAPSTVPPTDTSEPEAGSPTAPP